MRKHAGWWRLWIVLSGLWMVVLLGFGAVVLSQIQSAESRRDWAISFSCKGYVGGKQVDLSTAPDLDDIYRQLDVPSPPPGYKIELADEAKKLVSECRKAKDHDYAVEVSSEWGGDIIAMILAMVLVPLVVLCLGMLVAWVIRGFRENKA